MPTEAPSEVKFEIGHVLFIDIVGYSKLLINEQTEQMETLRKIVRATEQFRSAEAEGKLLRLPTGDGGALVFRTTPEAPVLCALEITRELKKHPEVGVRMGIHSGPVNAITDLNEHANIAGAGINIAQRVMDCGDAGHILLSRHVAEDLEHYPRWRDCLHSLGEVEIKHGDRISVVNLYQDELGNPAVPQKFGATEAAVSVEQDQTKSAGLCLHRWIIGGLIGTAAVFGLLVLVKHQHQTSSTPRQDASTARTEAATPIPDKSIAVLPFENLSSDKENAYFAEGIQDEILTRLSKIAALKVISRTSTQKFKSAPDNLRDVGKQLGVANVLEGSVQRIANAVHVNVQLIRAANDEHIWAESYNRKLDDVFTVEGEVASTIAEQLNARLTGAEQKAVADKPTQNTTAYDAYLRGIAIETNADWQAYIQSATAFAEAVRSDPQFALAWARLALAQSYLYFNGIEPTVNTAAAVKQAADRAISLQPELGEALLAQGVYRYRVLRDFQGALQSYNEAFKRVPSSSLILEQMAHVERRLGHVDDAIKHYQMAAEFDPRNLDNLITLSQVFQGVRQFDQAEAVLNRVLQISPGKPGAIAQKAFLYQNEGNLDRAATELAKMPPDSHIDDIVIARFIQLYLERNYEAAIKEIEASKSSVAQDPRTISLDGYCKYLLGRKDEARVTFQKSIALIQPTPDAVVPTDARQLRSYLALDYEGLEDKNKALAEAQRAVVEYKDDILASPFVEQVLAQIQTFFGDFDRVFAALPHLLEVPNGLTVGSLRVDPAWDPLRKDPRFQKLVAEKP
jgi:TolB-like protein/class 3 adenylate cyclase/Tfp pilus assembly protein PilF